MIFLIEYNRHQGRTVQIKRFRDWSKAGDKRLEIELDLNQRKIDHEVVLLEASKEVMVRRTHRRYFEDIHQIAEPIRSGQ